MDPRWVDIDGLGIHGESPRGQNLVDQLARTITLRDERQVLLVTGGRGAGVSTELRRLAVLLPSYRESRAFVVSVDGGSLRSPVDLLDVVLLLLAAGEDELASARGVVAPDTVRYELSRSIWTALALHEPRLTAVGVPKLHPVNLLQEMQANAALGEVARAAARGAWEAFVRAARAAFEALASEARALGRSRVVFVVDSLERAFRDHGDWDEDEALTGYEQLLFELRQSPVFSGPLVLTAPPALSLRRGVEPVHFLPMIRLRSRAGRPDAIGYAACRALVERRVDEKSLAELLGDDTPRRLDQLIAASGGSPRDLLSLLSQTIVEFDGRPMSERSFERARHRHSEPYKSVAQYRSEWFPLLRHVAQKGRLKAENEAERRAAEGMLNQGLVLRYENGESWFDVHPALSGLAELAREGDPHPLDVAPTAPTSRAPDPHALQRVTLTHIGPYADFSLDLRPGWNVLLGDNGCGKTTVIRAIALALAGTDPRAAAASPRLLRAGQPTGTVTVFSAHGDDSTALVRVRAEVRATTSGDTHVQQGRWLVLGFPAMRGVTARVLSGPTPIAPPVPGAHDLLPLLEGSTDSRLDDTRQWIVNTALRADGNEGEDVRARHRRLLDRWFSILQELMPGLAFAYERVDRESWQVLVKTADGTLPIEQLSQGMVSTIGWIGTLLRRLYEAYPESDTPEHEPALVLVDEIDAHLHPGWQQKIVPLVRSHFPRVQVVATSHSPLVAANLEPGEVVVFSRDAARRISASRVADALRGYRADQVLTSAAFGLNTTRSEYAQALLRDYAEALSRGADTPEARAGLAALTARVRREIPSPPETVAERLVVDEAMLATDDAVRSRLERSPEEAAQLEAMVKARRDGGAR